MKTLLEVPRFELHAREGNRLTLADANGRLAHVFVLEEDVLRVVVLPGGGFSLPRTWAIAPGMEDVAIEGRDRLDLSGFSLPRFDLTLDGDELRVVTAAVRLSIRLRGLHCRWEVRRGEQWRFAAADRHTQSYNFGGWGRRVYHYLGRESDEMYFGLGERSGDSNRAGQRFRMCNLDAMGYSARTGDPLYKHIPFYLTWKRDRQVAYGLFYDTLSDCSFDLGREISNYHGPYRYFVAEAGDLDFYFIAGQDPGAVTRRFTWLTGRPALMPRFALGYSGSGMHYAEAPDAAQRIRAFADLCREHDIPCDSFHLSSGYTTIGARRCVFTWNRDKFPDPEAFVRDIAAQGIKLIPNVKPCLLRDHPLFEQAASEGLFVKDESGDPALVHFWDDVGAYLDFTNPSTIGWWKEHVTDALLRHGMAGTWNDNNEFEIWDEQALVHGFGASRPAREALPLQTMLMIRASRDAQRAFAPRRRPFLVSRSGAAGMQRYVQTWSGDNATCWETLRFNIKMGLGLALSGVSNTGHDIGGFAGPPPDPELFVRWVQYGIFLPRFSIHSSEAFEATEPWMYPQMTGVVRDLIRLRYRLVPYLYDLSWRSHTRYEPIIRPTFYDFPQDQHCFDESDDMMLGACLLVAAVVAPGERERRVWLPAGSGWIDFWTGERHAGGRWVTLPAPLDHRVPLLAREGCAVALNIAEAHFGDTADERGFALFPHGGTGTFDAGCFEDDGQTDAYREGAHGHWRLAVECAQESLTVVVERGGRRPPQASTLTLLLPAAETRAVNTAGMVVVEDGRQGPWRRIVGAL